MPDRTINWGDSETEATYQTGDDDPTGGGNFVVARDTNGGVTLLEYDPAAGEWVSRGDVNLSGNDLSANAIDAGSVSAEALLGADVLNASENQILVAQGDGTLAVETQAQGPNPYDQAQTFTESDLNITTTNVEVSNGSIKLLNEEIGTEATAEPNTTSFSSTDSYGIVINPNTNISGINLEISANTSGATRSRVVRDSDATTLDTVDISALSAENRYDHVVNLSSGTDYRVILDAEGSSMTVGQTENASLPYTSNDIDITSGLNAEFDSTSLGNVWNLSAAEAILQTPQTNGSATIEWDGGVPTDIFEWDVATFTRTLDNETVDVFVAYSSDGGSTWTRTNGGNPVSRNYLFKDDPNITASDDVRIEAELSRSDTANNPTLDSAYRSWLV
jgi:hypothetical protein